MEQYQPYGDEWKAEVKRMTIDDLQKISSLKKESSENKDQFIDRIRDKFKNEYYAKS